MSKKTELKFVDYISRYELDCRFDLLLQIVLWAYIVFILLLLPVAQIVSGKWYRKEKFYKKIIAAQQEEIEKRDKIIEKLNYSYNHQFNVK